MSTINCRVFTGGHATKQLQPFSVALNRLVQYYRTQNVNIEVEFLRVDNIRENHYSVQDFTEWLSAGHIYFLISHPAQAIAAVCGWHYEEVGEELYRALKDRIGFPPAEQLRCSIFLQDKFQYLQACSNICIPSLQIFRTHDGDLSLDSKEGIWK